MNEALPWTVLRMVAIDWHGGVLSGMYACSCKERIEDIPTASLLAALVESAQEYESLRSMKYSMGKTGEKERKRLEDFGLALRVELSRRGETLPLAMKADNRGSETAQDRS